jgi:hypothetical protein
MIEEWPEVQVVFTDDDELRMIARRPGAPAQNGAPTYEEDRPMSGQQLRALMCMARQLELSNEDRTDLATVLLRREVTTWSTLTFKEAGRLLDALNGFHLVAHLTATRRPFHQGVGL